MAKRSQLRKALPPLAVGTAYIAADFERFAGSLVKVKTFTPVKDNRMWTGRLTGFADGLLTIDLAAVKQKGKAKKAAVANLIEIELKNVEKANLVAEI